MHRTFWILFAAALVNKLGTMVGPFLPLWLAGPRWNLDEQSITLLITAANACALLGGPAGGFLADRLGRRPTLILAMGLNAAALLSFPLAPALPALVGLMLARTFTNDMARPANSAAVADVVPAELRPRAFGLLRIAINVGFGIGTFLGGLLAARSFGWLFLIDGSTALVATLLVVALLPETRPRAPPPGAPALPADDRATPGATGRFLVLCACGLLVSLISYQLTSTLPLSLKRRGGAEIEQLYGTLLAVNALVVVVAQVPIGRLVERLPQGLALAAGALCYGLGYGAVAFSVEVLPLAGAVALLTLGEVLFFPLAAAVAAELAPASRRGRWSGWLQASYGVGAILSPLLGGWVLARHGDAALWGCSPPLGLLAAVCLVVFLRRPR